MNNNISRAELMESCQETLSSVLAEAVDGLIFLGMTKPDIMAMVSELCDGSTYSYLNDED